MTGENICPRDCPRRRASPNCHNEETCEHWRRHMEKLRGERGAREEGKRADRDYGEVRRIKTREVIKELRRRKRK